MHYRLPLYCKIIDDGEFDVEIWHGRGFKGTKKINAEIPAEYRPYFKQFTDYRIPFYGQEYRFPFAPFLFFKLIKSRPDVILSEGSSSIINSSLAFIYSKIFRKKFIWWSLGKLHGKIYSGFRRFINMWELVIERNSDAIFTYSTMGKEYFLSRGVVESKIFIGVNVFDTNAKLNEISATFESDFLDKRFFNIGFIGTLEPTKNLELLIDVVNKLNVKYSNFRLHIIGDGSHYNELLKYSSNSNCTTFYGRMNYGSSKILGNCDLFVLPGLGGLAIVEAMLNKLPVISGRADGTEYDLVDENNGFIIERMDYQNLFDKIEYLYNNPDLIKLMKKRSYEKITKELSFDVYYSVFNKMIYKVL